jgi:DNA polymerase-1
MKKVMIALDADYLIFECTEGNYVTSNTFANEQVDLKPFKKRFKQLVKDIEDEIAVEMLGKVKIKGIEVILSDPEGNFRYDIYPEYKANRKEGDRTETFYRLRKWAHKKYGYVKNCEADDVVAHYVRKGWIGASFDKDLLRGVAGTWFDVYYSRRHITETSQRDADNFNLIQNLTGDPTDNIKGLPRVAEKTAIKLLDKHGWDWDGVVAIYKEKGFDEDYAILTRRLTSMEQWSPKKGVKLWKPKKEKQS